jgi:hypothetical protein
MSVEGRRARRALAFGRFGGAEAFQLFMVNFHMVAAPLLFCWKLMVCLVFGVTLCFMR